LLGLYEGVPLTQRANHYSAAAPDRITIYMATICARCATGQEVVDLVRRVVIHEVGHHFGIDDERLTELGWGADPRSGQAGGLHAHREDGVS
jgi:predicted Zn-dependent protease with MMP-like domain